MLEQKETVAHNKFHKQAADKEEMHRKSKVLASKRKTSKRTKAMCVCVCVGKGVCHYPK
jgi:hypothetical protein